MRYKVINVLKDGRAFGAEEWREGLKNGTIVVPEETRQIMANFTFGNQSVRNTVSVKAQ